MREINLNLLIDAITKSNNIYRDTNQTPINRVLALWDLGNVLLKHKVDKPHSCGWKIQDKTNGLIKRMTIARAYRIRQIWPERGYIEKTFGGIKGTSIFIESLPILDPNGVLLKSLSKKLIDELIKYMNILPAVQFTKHIKNFKAKHKQGRVGEYNDRERYLKDYVNIQNCFLNFYKQLQKLILENKFDGIDELKSKIPLEERKAFSNFCLALTSKKNIAFYEPLTINSKIKIFEFQNMFNFFKELLEDSNDIRRARLRRVVPPESLVEMSDMLNSIINREKIINYQRRVKQSIKM
ncbi:MAG: hypothetical protein ABIK21_05135 [bacterium]